MDIRETLNKRPILAAGVVGSLAVAAVLIFQWIGGGGRQGRVSRMFYSDDDGKTWFADDVDKVYPFDHNTKPAYRVYVYRCGAGGQPFVGYLARFPDATKTALEALAGKRGTPEWSDAIYRANLSIQVKRPGDTKWVSQDSEITTVKCPDGNLAQGVIP